MSKRAPSITLTEVGKRVGVSGVTVSNVINGRGGVSAATRARVWAAVRETGYVADPAARSLAGGATRTVGLLVPDLSSQYVGEIVRGISEAVEAAGLELLVSAGHSAALGRGRVDLLRRLTDGLVLVLPNEHPDDLTALGLQGRGVVIEYRAGAHGLPTVNSDDYSGARGAVSYLAALGHTRIGFVGGPAGLVASEVRLSAYRDALEEAGLGVRPELVRPGDFSQPRGFAAAAELLGLARPPTAIFAANDRSAFGVLEALKHGGLRIPGDVSVVGFDDVPMASQVFPPLTTVQRPLGAMGRAAVETLLATLRGHPAETNLTLPTRLVVRATTGRPHDRPATAAGT